MDEHQQAVLEQANMKKLARFVKVLLGKIDKLNMWELSCLEDELIDLRHEVVMEKDDGNLFRAHHTMTLEHIIDHISSIKGQIIMIANGDVDSKTTRVSAWTKLRADSGRLLRGSFSIFS
jgi:hypothetical protein